MSSKRVPDHHEFWDNRLKQSHIHPRVHPTRIYIRVPKMEKYRIVRVLDVPIKWPKSGIAIDNTNKGKSTIANQEVIA